MEVALNLLAHPHLGGRQVILDGGMEEQVELSVTVCVENADVALDKRFIRLVNTFLIKDLDLIN